MYDVIIIGAGPSGLMAAIESSKYNKVLVIEKNSRAGEKLLITGGGRCNVTNLKEINRFLNEVEYNKKFLYSALNKFGPENICHFLDENGVKIKEEEDNKIFPASNKAVDVLNALLKNTTKVHFKYNEKVIKIYEGEIQSVKTDKDLYTASKVIVACGGSSFPQTGSTGDNLLFAKQIGQKIVDIFPAETSVYTKKGNNIAGTTIEEVKIKYEDKKAIGKLLFTHKGLSGSAIMKMSEYIYKGNDKEISIDLIPNYKEEELKNILNNYDKEKELPTFLSTYFSKKLSKFLIDELNINKKIKQLSSKEIMNLIDNLKNYKIEITSVNSIENAFVTGGGIDMNFIDSKTMQSKTNKGIYFVGEALDIHGPVGGYNITLALSTGFLAGSSINEKR